MEVKITNKKHIITFARILLDVLEILFDDTLDFPIRLMKTMELIKKYASSLPKPETNKLKRRKKRKGTIGVN